MNQSDFETHVLLPALLVCGLYSQAAHILLLGTALIESELLFLKQKQGRALGIYQIEEDTHKDVLRYLNRHSNRALKDKCLSACFYDAPPSDDALIHNLRYTTIIARLKYYMQPQKLPEWNDWEGMAAYYKKYYNTALGATPIEKAQAVFKRLIESFNAT